MGAPLKSYFFVNASLGNSFTDSGSRAAAISGLAVPDARSRQAGDETHDYAAGFKTMLPAAYFLRYIPQR